MPTFVVSDYLESAHCDKSGKDDVEVFQVSCHELGFHDKYFSKNAFRDDVKFFSAASRQFVDSTHTPAPSPSSSIRFCVSGYEHETVCDKTRKSADCYIVSCPQLGYKNRPLSRNAFRDEVRFHCSGDLADEDIVLEIDAGDGDVREASDGEVREAG